MEFDKHIRETKPVARRADVLGELLSELNTARAQHLHSASTSGVAEIKSLAEADSPIQPGRVFAVMSEVLDDLRVGVKAAGFDIHAGHRENALMSYHKTECLDRLRQGGVSMGEVHRIVGEAQDEMEAALPPPFDPSLARIDPALCLGASKVAGTTTRGHLANLLRGVAEQMDPVDENGLRIIRAVSELREALDHLTVQLAQLQHERIVVRLEGEYLRKVLKALADLDPRSDS